MIFRGDPNMDPTENGLDPCLHFQNIVGLGHVVVGAVFQAEDLVHVLTLGGKHDNRHVGVFPDALTNADAIQLGQHHIQQDHIVLSAKELGQRFLSIHGAIGFVALLLQGIFQSLQNKRLVIHKIRFAMCATFPRP